MPAPVVNLTFIRSLLVTVGHFDFELHQTDADTVVLNGKRHDQVYIEIPGGVTGIGNACKMEYKIDLVLNHSRIICSPSEPCFNVTWKNDETFMSIAPNLNYLLLAGNNINTINWKKSKLSKRSNMKNVDETWQSLDPKFSWARPERKHCSIRVSISQISLLAFRCRRVLRCTHLWRIVGSWRSCWLITL